MLLNKEILIGIYSYINTLTGSWVWVGLGSNNNWSTGSNWDMNISPPLYNALYFGGSTRLTPFNDLTINTPFNGINFNVGASSFTLSGNSFMLYSGGIVNNSTNLQTIANNILLSGTGGIVVNSAASDITLTGTITGTNLLIKTGNNILTLSGANTYSGNTTISAGMLKAGSTKGLSISSAFSVITGAMLDLNGYNSTIRAFASDTATGTITNSGSPAKLTIATAMSRTASTAASAAQLITGNLAIQLYGGSNSDSILANTNNTYNGGTTLGNGAGTPIVTRALLTATTYGSGSPGAITSGIFGTGPVTVGVNTTDKAQLYFGSGCTFNYDIIVNSLSGDNTFPGALRMESEGSTLAGTISANQADAIFSANNQAGRYTTVTGAIKGDYGVRVVSMSATTTALGSLTVTLSNTGVNINNYSGNTTLSGTGKATLRLGASNQIPNGPGKGNLNALSGTFDMNGFNETINGLFGAGIIDGRSGNPTLTIGDNDTSSIFYGVIKNTAGSLSAVKIGTGTLTLAGSSTFTGGITVNAGTVRVGHINALGAGPTTLNNTAIIDLSGTYNVGFVNLTDNPNSKIINTGRIVNTNFGSATVNSVIDDSTGGGIGLTCGTASSTPVFVNTNNKIRGLIEIINGSATFANMNNGTFGTGDVKIGNASNPSPTLIYNGSINSTISSRNILLACNFFTINGTPTGNLSGGGGVIAVNGTGNLILSGIYAETNAGTKLLTLSGTNTGDNIVSGSITDGVSGCVVSVVKRGTGKWILSGANTYTGTTSISAGTLVSVKGIASGAFTSSALTVTFSTPPPSGLQTYTFFPGSTVQSYPSVTLINAPGRTGSYNSSTSTLTIPA